MAKFGLGKGLADLKAEMGSVPNISVLTGEQRVAIRQVPIIQIGVNADQPRKTFTEQDLQDLTASVKEKGVLQPILLRAVKGKGFQYEIVAGERRYRASKNAGLAEIPAIVKDMTDENAMEVALIENVQRENLNPIEEAFAYQNLMDKCEYAIDDVSRLIGKSESYIRNLLRLKDLPADVQDLITSGQLSASHARTIAVAENPSQLAKEIIENKLSVSETSKIVKDVARSTKSRSFAVKTLGSNAVKEMEKSLSKSLNVDVKLKEKKGGAGEIILKFETSIQMKDLIDRLLK